MWEWCRLWGENLWWLQLQVAAGARIFFRYLDTPHTWFHQIIRWSSAVNLWADYKSEQEQLEERWQAERCRGRGRLWQWGRCGCVGGASPVCHLTAVRECAVLSASSTFNTTAVLISYQWHHQFRSTTASSGVNNNGATCRRQGGITEADEQFCLFSLSF